MSKKLEKNGLWESSRIILPEMRESHLNHKKEKKKHTKPIHDELRLEEFARIIADAIFASKEVQVTVFNEYQDKQYAGFIKKIDRQLRQIKLVNGEEVEWIRMDDMISIELN